MSQAHSGGPVRHSTYDARAGRSQRHTLRWVLLGVAVFVLFAVVSGGWMAWTGLKAKSDLEGARTDLAAVQSAWSSGSGDEALATLASVQKSAASAKSATHDPVWWFWGHVPVLGSPLKTVRGLTEAVDALASDALPSLESAADVAQPARMVSGNNSIDVVRLKKASGALLSASTVIDAQTRQVAALPASYVPQVVAARAELLDQLTTTGRTARTAAVAARVLPPMLGADGDRKYFLAFQNLAETRGTGGLVDAYATLNASKGALKVGRVGSNADLPALPAAVPGIDPDYLDRYAAQGATALWVNSNLSPDYPEVAKAWAAMWEASTREQVDGALAMDPVALKGILAVTGPVQAGELGTVDAASLEKLVYDTQYRLGKGVYERKRTMLAVGTATIDALLSGRGDRTALLETLVASARDGHILVWSSRDAEQQAMLDGGIAGALPTATTTPFVRTLFVNAAGTKLDAYLKSSLAYTVTGCSATARTSTVTLAVRNTAPAKGLPEYVVTRADLDPGAYVVGQNRVDVELVLGKGTKVVGATLDTKALGLPLPEGELPKTLDASGSGQILGQSERAGLPAYGVTLDLKPGQTGVLSLSVTEPPTAAKPLVETQNLVQPTAVTVDAGRCA